MENKRKGIAWIISAPSGTGKSTIAKQLIADDSKIHLSISYTTRMPRKGEKDGREYHFCTKEIFAQMIKENGFLEYASVFQHQYGTPKAPIEAILEKGDDVLCDVDWQGADAIASKLPMDTVRIFIIPPSIKALEERLVERGNDTKESISLRLSAARAELTHAQTYDYIIENDILEKAVAEIKTITMAERLKRIRIKNINSLMANL